MEKDFLPLTADPGDLGHYLFDQVPILRKLCEVLGSSDKPLEQTKASFPIAWLPLPFDSRSRKCEPVGIRNVTAGRPVDESYF